MKNPQIEKLNNLESILDLTVTFFYIDKTPIKMFRKQANK